MSQGWQRFEARWLTRAVSIESLAAFRILFGLVMTFAMLRLVVRGWVDELYILPRFHFPYPGFSWVRALPQPWMYAEVTFLAGCGLCIALGLRFRWAACLFLVGFLHLELIDQTTYLNHYYLVTLLGAILCCLPANGIWSIDAQTGMAAMRTEIPVWMVHLLRFQVGIVYFFAGVAKLNSDWLLAAQPLRIWLPIHSDLMVIGPWLTKSWVAYAASWGSAIFDLSLPFLLLVQRTRVAAYVAAIGFHLFTWYLFPIGMFPWIMLISALTFFPPDWPRKVWRRIFLASRTEPTPTQSFRHFHLNPWHRTVIGVYVLLQVIIPLRERLYHGRSAWTGHGFNFAWKVMIVEKTGFVQLYATDSTSDRRSPIDLSQFLTPRQQVMMAQDPALVRILAGHIAQDFARQGRSGVRIYAEAYATLNGRRLQRFIDPNVDLAASPSTGWILGLAE